MTSAPKTNDIGTTPTTSRSRRDDASSRTELGNEDSSSSAPSQEQLEDLVRAQEDLGRQIRELAARQLVEHESNGNGGGARSGQVIARARTELLQELLREQQEQARRQLADAARSGEDAVAGVVRSLTTIVQSMMPTALVRPEDLIEATYALADQGLRMSRSVALTVTAGSRNLAPFG